MILDEHRREVLHIEARLDASEVAVRHGVDVDASNAIVDAVLATVYGRLDRWALDGHD